MTDKPTTRQTIFAVLVVVFLILTGKIVYASIVYDDWTCAFAKCVKVK